MATTWRDRTYDIALRPTTTACDHACRRSAWASTAALAARDGCTQRKDRFGSTARRGQLEVHAVAALSTMVHRQIILDQIPSGPARLGLGRRCAGWRPESQKPERRRRRHGLGRRTTAEIGPGSARSGRMSPARGFCRQFPRCTGPALDRDLRFCPARSMPHSHNSSAPTVTPPGIRSSTRYGQGR
jgi:hypothetical protein